MKDKIRTQMACLVPYLSEGLNPLATHEVPIFQASSFTF